MVLQTASMEYAGLFRFTSRKVSGAFTQHGRAKEQRLLELQKPRGVAAEIEARPDGN
jgi:hypothetical protein